MVRILSAARRGGPAPTPGRGKSKPKRLWGGEGGRDGLYLPPIHPIGLTKRKGQNNALTAGAGRLGSPWAIGGKGGHKGRAS